MPGRILGAHACRTAIRVALVLPPTGRTSFRTRPTSLWISNGFGARPSAADIDVCLARFRRPPVDRPDFAVTAGGICATQRLNSGARATMSRRVKKPLRPAGDRPKGARPYRGSAAERAPAHRSGGKPPARFPAAPPRVAKPFVPEPEKVVADAPPLPTKVQTVVVTADENSMRVDRF